MNDRLSLSKDKIRVLLLEGVNDSAVELFRGAGYSSLERLSKALDGEELQRALRGVHILGIRSRTQITDSVLAGADRLITVGCFSVGTNQVDLGATRRRGIPVFNAPFSNTRSVAELVIGEIIPVSLTIPVVLPWVGSWQWSFAVWSAPVLAIAVLVWAFAPRVQQPAATLAAARRWWPDWNDSLIWKLGLMLGAVNAAYFGSNAFLPDYLTHTGQTEWISPALTALNVGQLPASLLLLGAASRLERATWPYLFAGLGIIAAIVFIVFGRGIVVVAAASVIGFFCALILILALALPPLLAAPEDVHRVSAAMFTISYTCAIIIPVICGAVWDFTGIPQSTFIPMGIMCVVLIVLAPSVTHVGRRT